MEDCPDKQYVQGLECSLCFRICWRGCRVWTMPWWDLLWHALLHPTLPETYRVSKTTPPPPHTHTHTHTHTNAHTHTDTNIHNINAFKHLFVFISISSCKAQGSVMLHPGNATSDSVCDRYNPQTTIHPKTPTEPETTTLQATTVTPNTNSTQKETSCKPKTTVAPSDDGLSHKGIGHYLCKWSGFYFVIVECVFFCKRMFLKWLYCNEVIFTLTTLLLIHSLFANVFS